ncbi:tyrosine-protein phosphatase 10D-like, partial [Penaeus vannamei]|uniref:tyrosine-protein phosphatase 10D-like n=1 Tax=Penaeus vannamei TaxID=6689 RepID=UPI00387FA054
MSGNGHALICCRYRTKALAASHARGHVQWPIGVFLPLAVRLSRPSEPDRAPSAPQVWSADVVIQIPPERVRDQDGYYRLDYWPPQGIPQPNTTFTPSQVVEGVKLTRALPGTKYDFQLYYTNATINDYPTWTASITTVPKPPTNLTIQKGKVVSVTWDPPVIGEYSSFKLKQIPLSEPQNSNKNIYITE